MAEACDVVHAVLVERVVNAVHADQQAAMLARLSGSDIEWPTLDARLAELDADLVAEPISLDPQELELRDALGLRRRHG